MNRDKVKQAIINQTPVTYNGETWRIDKVSSSIVEGKWYSKLFLFSPERKVGILAEVKDVSGGAYL